MKVRVETEGASETASSLKYWLGWCEFDFKNLAEAFRFLADPSGMIDPACSSEDRIHILKSRGALIQELGPGWAVFHRKRIKNSPLLWWSLWMPRYREEGVYRHFEIDVTSEEALAAAALFDDWYQAGHVYGHETVDRLQLSPAEVAQVQAALSPLIGLTVARVYMDGGIPGAKLQVIQFGDGAEPSEKKELLGPEIHAYCPVTFELADGSRGPLEELAERLDNLAPVVRIAVGERGDLWFELSNGQRLIVVPFERLRRIDEQWSFLPGDGTGMYLEADRLWFAS
ncbi:MAG TPA: hypothetical protein VG944_21445 [Fimbriimonas sp.]|nr:hypothetical protein [Fimbriimonas sp.]